MWSHVWGRFLAAHGRPAAFAPLRAIRRNAPGCRVYDHLTRTADGTLVGLDVCVHHPTPLRLVAFGRPASFLPRAEERKRALYRRTAWHLQPEVPRCVPLAATPLGAVGEAAQHFFRSVAVAHLRSREMAAGALQAQNLSRGQHLVYWRRRICVGLRIAVASQGIARIREAALPLVRGEVEREAQEARSWAWFVDTARAALLPAVAVAGGEMADALHGDVGLGFGGDQPFPGVVGDGFPRARASLGVAAPG